MTGRGGTTARAFSGWLIAGLCAAVGVLAWFGYTTSLEWRRSSDQLLARRTEEMADLLVRALARDMRGVHDQVLRTVQRDQVTLDHPEEITDIVSTAFARYPYPECFFVWTRAIGEQRRHLLHAFRSGAVVAAAHRLRQPLPGGGGPAPAGLGGADRPGRRPPPRTAASSRCSKPPSTGSPTRSWPG